MGIHLGRVGHIGIHVSDVDRSIDFYRKVLGLKKLGVGVRPTSGGPFASCASTTSTTMWCCSSFRRTINLPNPHRLHNLQWQRPLRQFQHHAGPFPEKTIGGNNEHARICCRSFTV
jgi:catechol 2,3-dioxygenase-like lactoylglutathione lyase family enzyme